MIGRWGTDLLGQETESPLLLCLLGRFRALKTGRPLEVHGAKAQALICALALASDQCMARDGLLEMLWPDSSAAKAIQSLNSLVFSVRNVFGEVVPGAPAILNDDGYYRLNFEAGIAVDVKHFVKLADQGDQLARTGDRAAAVNSYTHAVALSW